MKKQNYISNPRNQINELRRLGEKLQFREFLYRCEIFWMTTNDLRVLPLIAQAQALLGNKKQADIILQRVIGQEEVCDNASCLVDVAAVLIFVKNIFEWLSLEDSPLYFNGR